MMSNTETGASTTAPHAKALEDFGGSWASACDRVLGCREYLPPWIELSAQWSHPYDLDVWIERDRLEGFQKLVRLNSEHAFYAHEYSAIGKGPQHTAELLWQTRDNHALTGLVIAHAYCLPFVGARGRRNDRWRTPLQQAAYDIVLPALRHYSLEYWHNLMTAALPCEIGGFIVDLLRQYKIESMSYPRDQRPHTDWYLLPLAMIDMLLTMQQYALVHITLNPGAP